MEERSFIAIDLKSFYASVECADRGLDPLGVNLVVADQTRTEKTICLAVSPSLKAYGIPGRARLFEVIEQVKEVNMKRLAKAPGHRFRGSSYVDRKLKEDPALSVDFIVAPPQMRRYIEMSKKIFHIYMKYISPEDIHIYSVDEVFIDATHYLKNYHMTAHELAMKMIREVLKETGITATAGIGTNMYLCKIAMDIVAKRMPADADGVRIAELDEMSYRRLLWNHVPITDFWRIGRGYATKLAKYGMYTMGDVARCSVGKESDYYNEDLLYKLFGVGAELLIDHAWGYEPCEIKDIKAYVPENNSLSQGQVLSHAYTFEKARIVIREMTENLTLELVEKHLVTDQMVITVCYDSKAASAVDDSEVKADHYGRPAPKPAHGSINLETPTSSTRTVSEMVWKLYDDIVDRALPIRRIYVVANHVKPEAIAKQSEQMKQLSLFDEEVIDNKNEKELQKAVLGIKNKYGKNAIIKGTNLEEGATGIERNNQVGGHKA